MFCSNCGKKHKENATFCGGCGLSINESSYAPFLQQNNTQAKLPHSHMPFQIQHATFHPVLQKKKSAFSVKIVLAIAIPLFMILVLLGFLFATQSSSMQLNTIENPASDFEYEVVTGGIEITKYVGNTIKVGIPRIIEGSYVVAIGNNAFENRSAITVVVLPDGINSIGSRAFLNCTGLTNIYLPDSVTKIGSYAFSNCSSLKSISLPNSIITIGVEVFADCTSLTNINIPESISSIGPRAFAYCTSLTTITIPDSIKSIEGTGAIEEAIVAEEERVAQEELRLQREAERQALIDSGTAPYDLPPAAPERPFSDKYFSPSGEERSYSNSAFIGCENLTNVMFKGQLYSVTSYEIHYNSLIVIDLPKTFYNAVNGIN